jgi:Ankyrin repeats (3 copies)/Ankyrin repeat
MYEAASGGSLAAVKWLQSLGLDPRALTATSDLPLRWACQYKHPHLVQYFLSLPGAAADVHARSSKGQAPLHIAALYAADSIVQLLLQRGAVADARNTSGCTPLMVASSLPVVKLLLAAGADATAFNSMGMTVLQYQAKHGACAGTVCLLLKAGADPTATVTINGSSVTAATLPGINGHFALEALLSRAADDYRKKHSNVHTTAEKSSSSSGGTGTKVNSSSGSSSSSSSSTVEAADAECSDSVQGAVTAVTDSSAASAASTAASDDNHVASTAATADIVANSHSGSNNEGTTDANDAAVKSSSSSSSRVKLVNTSSHVLTAVSLLLSCAGAVQLYTTAV